MYPPPPNDESKGKKPGDEDMPDVLKELLAKIRAKKPGMTIVTKGKDEPSTEEICMMMAMSMAESAGVMKLLRVGGRCMMAVHAALSAAVEKFLSKAGPYGAKPEDVEELRAALYAFTEPSKGDHVAFCSACDLVWRGPSAVAGGCPKCGDLKKVQRKIYDREKE